MKKMTLSIVLLFLLTLAGCAYDPPIFEVEGGWEKLPSSPTGLVAPGSSYRDGQFVLTGGIRADGSESPEVLLFDDKTKRWSEGPRMKVGRFQHAQAALADGSVLIIGGRKFYKKGFQSIRSCELLLANRSKVVKTASLPSPMQTPTVHTLSDGRVLAIGGKVAAVYDPATHKWEKSIYLREPRLEQASVLINDRTALVIGGTSRDTIELINLEQQTSQVLPARLPFPIDDTAATVLPSGKIWIIGGQNTRTGNTINDTFVLTLIDHKTATIKEGPRLPLKRGVADHLLVPTPRGIVMLSGESQYQSADVELKTAFLLDPENLGIVRLPDLCVPHDDAAAYAEGSTVVVTAGQVTGGEASFVFLKLPRPVKTTEMLTLPALD